MSTTVSTAVLKNVPMFASFPDDALRVLAGVVTRKSASRGTTIISGGDPTESLIMTLSRPEICLLYTSDAADE